MSDHRSPRACPSDHALRPHRQAQDQQPQDFARGYSRRPYGASAGCRGLRLPILAGIGTTTPPIAESRGGKATWLLRCASQTTAPGRFVGNGRPSRKRQPHPSAKDKDAEAWRRFSSDPSRRSNIRSPAAPPGAAPSPATGFPRAGEGRYRESFSRRQAVSVKGNSGPGKRGQAPARETASRSGASPRFPAFGRDGAVFPLSPRRLYGNI